MRFILRKFRQFVAKLSGSTHRSLIGELLYQDARNVLDFSQVVGIKRWKPPVRKTSMDLNPDQSWLYPHQMSTNILGTEELQEGKRMIKTKILSKILSSCLILSSLLFFSCGTNTRPDPSPPYTDGNYMSAEMEICGNYFFGVGGCHYATGASTATALKIQGYNTGEISVFSDLCHVDKKQRYGTNETVSWTLADLFGESRLDRTHSCTLKVIVSPDPIKGSEEAVFPRIGQLYIEVQSPGVDTLRFPTSADQVRESEQKTTLSVPVNANEDGQYLLSRCTEPSIQGVFQKVIVLQDPSRKLSCKYQLAAKTVTGKKYNGVFLRNVFLKSAVLLARPKVTRESGKICIEADPTTSTFLSIDDTWTNKTSLCANGAGPFKIRVWTTKRNYFEIVK